MLYDATFLKKLDENRTKTTYARIIALSLDETPIETIEGRVTQGSINLDGNSAVRRTCSLTMVAQNYDYSNYLWGLNTKFKLEVGLENTIDPTYPNIIWFKQGTYYISSFNTSRSTNNFTITIQGKDKMCGLNGEVGGTITASTDFGTIEEKDKNGDIRIIRLPLKDIIRNVVHMYGGEPMHNIIINDLDMSGLELLEYRYDENTPLYLYREAVEGSEFINIHLGDRECSVEGTDITKLSQLNNTQLEMLVNPMYGQQNTHTDVTMNSQKWWVAKVTYGDTAGYRFTDLTYAGDLIGGVGENLTSILDKIKNMLGDFEYFYNLDGQFVFQKKKIYINSSYTPLQQDSDGHNYVSDSEPIAYTFKNGELVTTFNNNPDIQNLRNDFSVWGNRIGISGKEIPVHMRYVLDHKPISYTSINVTKEIKNGNTIEVTRDPALIEYNKKYGTNVDGQDSWTYVACDKYSIDNINKITYCDWREIIYQMGRDYYKYAHILDDFEAKIIKENPEFPTGKTGYENYYLDLVSFWRDLYDSTVTQEEHNSIFTDSTKTKEEYIKNVEQEITNINKILASDPDNINKQNELKNKQTLLKTMEKYLSYYYEGDYQCWNKVVYEAPQNLNFWFDFLDTDGELSQFSVKNVGCRPKAINDSNVKAIYFRETPNIIFSTNLTEDMKESTAYTYINISPAYENIMFSISSQGKSAKATIDELLYKHSYCIESATINTIPIYYLEPNVRIQIIDEETKLNGYYTISKMSIPLTYNGTMSITATRAADLNI